jgi:hypothetical protein
VSEVYLPLLSADMLASNWSVSRELKTMIAASTRSGPIRVIPVIARPVLWDHSPFAVLQALPRDAQPLTMWADSEAAMVDVAKGVELVVRQLQAPPPDVTTPQLPDTHTLAEVFKQSGTPTVTFVEPTDFYLLKLALGTPGRGVVIEGPSGIGKTTALRRAIEQLAEAGDNADFEVLSARDPEHVERIAKIGDWHHDTVVIDDFHRLDVDIRARISDYIKILADTERVDRKLVVVGIPGTGDHLIDFGFDLTGRLDVFRLGDVADEVVLAMVAKGEAALNVALERKDELVRAASGSLNVAQMLCFKACAKAGVLKTQQATIAVRSDVETVVSQTLRDMDAKFHDVIAAFASIGGPDQMIGIELLDELGRAAEGVISLDRVKHERRELKGPIQRFVSENYMADVKDRCPTYEQHILYDANTHQLAYDDPQLAFYLRTTPSERWIQAAGKLPPRPKNRVFISYSHTDEEWLRQLRTHLKPLERENIVDVWDDTRLETGTQWREEIRRNLESARIAVLLVSASFLASEFIADDELPPLLEAAEQGGTTIMPILVSPSRFEESPLAKFQAANRPNRTLLKVEPADREELFVKLSRDIESAVRRDPR